MSRYALETAAGTPVLGIAVCVLFLAYSKSSFGPIKGYILTAKFSGVGSLSKGSDIRISRIQVGSVTQLKINPETYLPKNYSLNKQRHKTSSLYNDSNL